jgi:hypothetical protein
VNIFILDKDPSLAAQMYCDIHTSKIVLELAQMLSTAVSVLDYSHKDLYQPCYTNHPCNIWVRQSKQNFLWALEHGIALSKEYNFRYNKVHKSSLVIITACQYKDIFPDIGLTEFAQVMPKEYKICGDAVNAYRRYYIGEKQHILKYTKREKPNWLRII